VPNKVVIRIDPDSLPHKLAEYNEVIKSLMDVVKNEEPTLRICEDGMCQKSTIDPDYKNKVIQDSV
jgi:hypothetical protein